MITASLIIFPKKERNIKNEEDTKLKKITGFVLEYDSPEQCQNMQELQEYAQKHGYKKGWCYYQAKQRGWIS